MKRTLLPEYIRDCRYPSCYVICDSPLHWYFRQLKPELDLTKPYKKDVLIHMLRACIRGERSYWVVNDVIDVRGTTFGDVFQLERVNRLQSQCIVEEFAFRVQDEERATLSR